MDVLRPLVGFLILSSLLSCAKLSYLTEQGLGQINIMSSARENDEVLKDKKVSSEIKEKILKIKKYKKYFYSYWDRKPSDIYSKTTLLDRDAVTYLVISSKPNEIKAKKHCFPFSGCFPYLGFFKKDSAKDYVSELTKKGHDTYMRRVLAFSTLGYLDDPILSTFFEYDEYELAETIFHELFHTIFFVKDEVDLNENLANYFGKKMVLEYFKDSKEIEEHFSKEALYSNLLQEIVDHAKKLELVLKRKQWKTEKKKYLEDIFYPAIKNRCEHLGVSNCWPLKIKWNSATFAAFMTYEKNQDAIGAYASKFPGGLKSFFSHIEKRYEDYQNADTQLSFEKFLLAK